jgi:hypothetical protein
VSSAPDLSKCAFEILLDGFAAGITDGPGNWLVGGRVFGGIILSSLELALSIHPRNVGLNALGAQAGLFYFFEPGVACKPLNPSDQERQSQNFEPRINANGHERGVIIRVYSRPFAVTELKPGCTASKLIRRRTAKNLRQGVLAIWPKDKLLKEWRCKQSAKEVFETDDLLKVLTFGFDILRRLLRRVSQMKPTFASLRF